MVLEARRGRRGLEARAALGALVLGRLGLDEQLARSRDHASVVAHFARGAAAAAGRELRVRRRSQL
jgi:hypothetical protein